DKEAQASKAAGLPLRELEFQLVSFIIKPYVQIGVTPARTWPDVLLSLGPALQLGVGTVKVNDEKESVAVATSSSLLSGFAELEIVFWRFGDGALSIFTSTDSTGSGRGTEFFPKEVDGMKDFRADFSRSVAGNFG